MAANRGAIVGGPVLRATAIYFSIALLALYGDLVKRVLPATVALGVVYTAAVFILVILIIQRRSAEGELGSRVREARWINLFTGILIAVYTAQFITSFDWTFLESFSHLLYMVIPLSYILVVQKARFDFSLSELANHFLWMMIPINIVGLIQFTVNPSFLIFTNYDEAGGIIARNLLEGGTFDRYPSIFASADRYSAMGLMQFYFSWMLVPHDSQMTRKAKLWMAVNLLSSLVALGVAGARSRVLIVMVVFLLIGLSEVIQLCIRYTRQGRPGAIVILVGGLAVLAAVLVPLIGSEDYPILLFLQQSFGGDDIYWRVEEAISLSVPSEETSLFGAGLGTIGVGGKPGEFGIMSTWGESGIVWGGLILLAFSSICVVLAKLTVRAILIGQWVGLVKVSVPLLMLIFALFAGMTSSFELSSGILLGCAIAVLLRRSHYQRRY